MGGSGIAMMFEGLHFPGLMVIARHNNCQCVIDIANQGVDEQLLTPPQPHHTEPQKKYYTGASMKHAPDNCAPILPQTADTKLMQKFPCTII